VCSWISIDNGSGSDRSVGVQTYANLREGGVVVKKKRTPLDLMDDIYSLALWLTGSETKATELVNCTYGNVDYESSETEVFKTLRACYFDTLDHNATTCLTETPCFSKERAETSMMKRDADIRLSVLLSAISGLKHRSISRIIGKPLKTIRVWLSEGRKSLVATLVHASC